MPDQPIVDVRGLTKRYGGRLAVNNISFSVQRGEVFAFIGPNGSGKSTTVRMLCGILKPSGGGVRCAGLKREVDWAADAVELVVPRACLSKPRWVQVVVAAGNYAGDGRRSYIDVAGKAGHAFSGWSDKIRRG